MKRLPWVMSPLLMVLLFAPIQTGRTVQTALSEATTGEAPAHFVVPPDRTADVANGNTDTLNWAGYANEGATFTDVQGTFTQPSISCGKQLLAYAAFWVGIDGFNSDTVEQIGTDSVCLGNETSYAAFYELYPASAVTLSTTTYPVVAGDTLSADVTATSATTFTLTLKSSEGWTFSTTGSAPSATESSAEWIAEAPSLCLLSTCTVLPLAKFGTVNFSGASVTGNGTAGPISAFSNQQVVMTTKKGKVKAQPSSLPPAGTSFSVTWHHA
ncbi:MAG TPA: G1 family glutamic endopeptidase [Acidimicrobiales bacterium]|nr:G1 family glutamic endopeptidase [Acidimicrobiales bacterium]